MSRHKSLSAGDAVPSSVMASMLMSALKVSVPENEDPTPEQVLSEAAQLEVNLPSISEIIPICARYPVAQAVMAWGHALNPLRALCEDNLDRFFIVGNANGEGAAGLTLLYASEDEGLFESAMRSFWRKTLPSRGRMLVSSYGSPVMILAAPLKCFV